MAAVKVVVTTPCATICDACDQVLVLTPSGLVLEASNGAMASLILPVEHQLILHVPCQDRVVNWMQRERADKSRRERAAAHNMHVPLSACCH